MIDISKINQFGDFYRLNNKFNIKKLLQELEPFEDKWQSFGWETLKINGHSLVELIDAFNLAKNSTKTPTVLIAETVKGKGVSFMENNPDFHGKAPDDDELLLALKEIDKA